MKIGKDSVVIGNVPAHLEVGDGSVIIGATDANGNTIINQPMAVGRGARAGLSSIAIGAFAGAGVSSSADELAADLQRLGALIAQQNNEALATGFEKLRTELARPAPSRSGVMSAWEVVKAAGAINGAHGLLLKISAGLVSYFGT
jgi:Pyruvate/2-oxoacid:ferredoxin oxidoreductase gamma subunit